MSRVFRRNKEKNPPFASARAAFGSELGQFVIPRTMSGNFSTVVTGNFDNFFLQSLKYLDEFSPKTLFAHRIFAIRGVDTLHGELIGCRVADLRLHPSYLRHQLTVHNSKLSALATRGDLVFQQPLVITTRGII